jgi:Kef-type K+ transport system membrane component KefB
MPAPTVPPIRLLVPEQLSSPGPLPMMPNVPQVNPLSVLNPPEFLQSFKDNFGLVCGVIGALLVGKWIAVQIAGRAFGYTQVTRWTMWSLTLPQVAATLAATLVAYDTFDPAHRRLIDAQLLNVVLVLMLTTSIIGPVLTQRFLPRMLAVVRAKIHQRG